MSYGGPQKKRNGPTPSIRGAVTGGETKPSIPVQDFDGRAGRPETGTNAPNTRILDAQILKYEK